MRRPDDEGRSATGIAQPANASVHIPTTEQKIDALERTNGANIWQAGAAQTFIAAHVELYGGIVTGQRITDAHGTRFEPFVVEETFFIELVDVTGGRFCLWDGACYEAAIVEANDCCRDFGVGLIDLVGRGAA